VGTPSYFGGFSLREKTGDRAKGSGRWETITGRQVPMNEDLFQILAAHAAWLCAGHVRQFGGASPPANLMEVKA